MTPQVIFELERCWQVHWKLELERIYPLSSRNGSTPHTERYLYFEQLLTSVKVNFVRLLVTLSVSVIYRPVPGLLPVNLLLPFTLHHNCITVHLFLQIYKHVTIHELPRIVGWLISIHIYLPVVRKAHHLTKPHVCCTAQ